MVVGSVTFESDGIDLRSEDKDFLDARAHHMEHGGRSVEGLR